jgi:hypothetical protein
MVDLFFLNVMVKVELNGKEWIWLLGEKENGCCYPVILDKITGIFKRNDFIKSRRPYIKPCICHIRYKMTKANNTINQAITTCSSLSVCW